jgi:hypothetical protein
MILAMSYYSPLPVCRESIKRMPHVLPPHSLGTLVCLFQGLSLCFAEAVRMLNLAIGMFEDIGRLSMAAKHYKVLLRLLQQGLLEICDALKTLELRWIL